MHFDGNVKLLLFGRPNAIASVNHPILGQRSYWTDETLFDRRYTRKKTMSIYCGR